MNNINIFNDNNKNNDINVIDNNNNNFNNSEDEFYEDKNEKEIYYRMNIENSKIKIELNKIKEFHSKKIKSLDKNELSFIDIKNDYINNFLPEIKVYENEKKDKIINLMNTEYLLKEKPETGSCLILEIENDKDNNNNNLNIIGVSEKYFQIGNLLKQQKIKSNVKNNNNIKNDKKIKNNNIKTKNKISNNNINNNNINNTNNNINNNNIINNNINENNNNKFIGKKRKKYKRKYIKE